MTDDDVMEAAWHAQMKRPSAWVGEARATRPRRRFGPSSEVSRGSGHPLLFGFSPTWDMEEWPDGGGYPHGFLKRAYATLGVTNPEKVLHLCSGSVRVGVTVDMREVARPRVVADATAIPFADATFDWVMADPPYNREYARNLYGDERLYPAPSRLLGEAARVLRPGGRVGMLHFLVPPPFGHPLDLVGVWGVTTGLGYQIRAWTVYQKRAAELGL